MNSLFIVTKKKRIFLLMKIDVKDKASSLEPQGKCVVQTEIEQSQFRTKTGYHSHTTSQDMRADDTAIQCNKQHQTHQELKRAAKMQKYQWILDLVVFLLSDAIAVGTKLFLPRLARSVGNTNQQPGQRSWNFLCRGCERSWRTELALGCS